MHSTIRIVATVAMATLGAACGQSGRPADESATSSEAFPVLRGYAQYGHEVRVFTPCDSMLPLWVVDSTQALWAPYRALAPDPADTAAVFAVVQGHVGPSPETGFGAEYVGTLVVAQVLYVAREGYGCAAPWDRFAFRAFGNEPFWSLTVAADSMTLIRPGETERTWHGSRRVPGPEGLTITVGDPASGGVAVRLTRKPCRDTMAGSYFGYAAAVRLGGDSIVGCALVGGGQ